MKLTEEKHYLLLIMGAVILLFGSHLSALPINIMEARNFITAREMILDGNWLLTTMNELPRYEKPPLPTWLTAFSGMIFGMNSITALRIPAVALTTILMISSYKFCHKALQLNKEQSLINTLIIATSFFMLFSGRNGQWDIFTHGFMMVGIHFFFQLFQNENKGFQHAILSGLFIGLSFMSKGPVSLFALFLPFIFAYGIVYRFKHFKKHIVPLFLLLVIVFLLSAWWPYYIYLFDGDSATRIADKETTAWSNKNVRPFYYYWSFFTQSGIWTIPAFVGLLFPYMKNRVNNKKAYRFTFLWTIIAVVLLSLIPEKKSRYLLPVLIPLGMNTGFYIEYLIRKFKDLNKKEQFPVYFNFGIIVLVAVSLPILIFFLFSDVASNNLFWTILTLIGVLLAGLFIAKNLLKKDIKNVFYGTIAFVLAVTTFGFPLVDAVKTNEQFNPTSNLRVIAKNQSVQIYDLVNSAPEIVWDYGKPIPTLYVDENTVKHPSESRFGLLVQPISTEILEKHFSEFNVTKIDRFDHNLMNEGESGYKYRLSRDFYILTKK